jgi:superfamily II DNA helicase RecQ
MIMGDDYLVLSEHLGNSTFFEQSFTHPAYLRLQRAAAQTSISQQDLAVLLRQIIRIESERQRGVPVTLRVPSGEPWPNRTLWEDMNITVIAEREHDLLIQAAPWHPAWLEGALEASPEIPLFTEQKRNLMKPAMGDFFLRKLDKRAYRSLGQKQAIRSIFTAGNDATLVVNLPTGSGKSLCAQLPGLLLTKAAGTVVVVVPTVALAIDQERAVKSFVKHATAYYSSPSREVENLEIRKRIMDGTQRIVFVSPESVLQSLHFPLLSAVARGLLTMLVVDEAHIVSMWGDGFRSSFQELAGFRRMLLRKGVQPFRTLLLTATLTESCLDMLESLFTGPGEFRIVSAVQLRPEPAYWFKFCDDEEMRQRYMREALRFLPRPLILYTTEVKDAVDWGMLLRKWGYDRLAVMTGETPNDKREQIIANWHQQKLDIVVATSAFGLGVDQSEVRVVLHACVPENLDRYYQEVGRGGRDGRASLSLVMYTKEDIKTAERMNRKILIGIERGQQRWKRMFERNQELSDGRYRVPVTVTPSNNPGDIDMTSNENKAWNIRTLTLMSRAGMLELDWDDHPYDPTDQASYRAVRIINHKHLLKETWEAFVSNYRIETRDEQDEQLRLMLRLLEGQTCSAPLFSNIYKIKAREVEPARYSVSVSRACGGCPACRRSGQQPYAIEPRPQAASWSHPADSVSVLLEKRYLKHGGRMVLTYPDNLQLSWLSSNEKRDWTRLFRWFVGQGIRHFVLPCYWIEQLANDSFFTERHVLFFSDIALDYMETNWIRVPTLVWAEADPKQEACVWRVLQIEYGGQIVAIFPEGMEHPDRPGSKFKDFLTCRQYASYEFKLEVGLV